MVGYAYSTKLGENMAKAVSHSLNISTKITTQVCRFIYGMPLAKAKWELNEVLKMNRAIPMFTHYKETAHKPGMAVGRYPVKAVTNVLKVLASAEANAQFKGMNSADLVVHHAVAQQGPTARGQGRTGGQMRQTHVEIVLAAKPNTPKAPKTKKVEAKK